MLSTGQAWQDELQSFLPHALDCVDPNCLRPLCVNLKLTLRHAQLCEKSEQCKICQGMKSLAVTHSNSCRDYYCRVPFCMEAKVTTQQQILMDELVKPTDAADLNSEDDNKHLQISEAGENCGNDDNVITKVTTSSSVPVTNKATPRSLTRMSRDKCQEKVPSSDQDVVWPMAEYPPPVSKSPRVSTGKTAQPEWTEQSNVNPRVESPKRFPAQKSPQSLDGVWVDRGRSIPSAETTTNPPKAPCQPGTKRKLLSVMSIDKSQPPFKVHRFASDLSNATEDYCPEMEIIDSKSSRRPTYKTNGALTPTDGKNLYKRNSTNAELLPSAPSSHVASKQNKKENSIPRAPRHPIHNVKKNSSTAKDSSKVAALNSMYVSSEMCFPPVDQVASQFPDDSVDCYIDEVFSTPPPSPTFEVWFGKTVRNNDSSLKTVLLETLFQLLGVVTQPKTKQQEALFVDLLERTLRVMKTEIAKQ